jgi:hypothetical protein
MIAVDVTIPPNATATVRMPDGSSTDVGSGVRTFTCVL